MIFFQHDTLDTTNLLVQLRFGWIYFIHPRNSLSVPQKCAKIFRNQRNLVMSRTKIRTYLKMLFSLFIIPEENQKIKILILN